LGKRIQAIAPHISKQLTPGLSIGEYATIVHGDYKAMNAFLPVPSSSEDDNDDDDDVYMIDFASAGVGLGMSDVAMHIVHAVRPCDLKDGGEEQLVDGYLCALNAALRRRQTKGGDYPTDVAMRHYRLGCVDYLRFILGRFWRSATLESFEAKKKSQNTTLINRDVDAAMRFIEKVDLYLEEFEQENERD
jgi:thiamine kinase-like enzyme